jgi:hypothetical protein
MVNTHALLIIIRVVGNHAKVLTGDVIKAKTYDGKPTDKNKINVKLATLGIRDSARYKRILFSERKYWEREASIIILAVLKAVKHGGLRFIGNKN